MSQRINRARHFMRAASSCLNRTEVIHSFMKILCSQYIKCKCKNFGSNYPEGVFWLAVPILDKYIMCFLDGN